MFIFFLILSAILYMLCASIVLFSTGHVTKKRREGRKDQACIGHLCGALCCRRVHSNS